MLVIGGPPGSGKSSLFPLSESGFDHFNVDDRCAALNYGSYQGIPSEVRERAGKECATFVEEHIQAGKSFAVETTMRTTVSLQQAARAKRKGFEVELVFVATSDVETNVKRVTMRARSGGHAAPASRVRETYTASLANLPAAVRQLDCVTIYDNSAPGRRPRLVLRSREGKVTFVAADAPAWVTSLRHAIRGDDRE